MQMVLQPHCNISNNKIFFKFKVQLTGELVHRVSAEGTLKYHSQAGQQIGF